MGLFGDARARKALKAVFLVFGMDILALLANLFFSMGNIARIPLTGSSKQTFGYLLWSSCGVVVFMLLSQIGLCAYMFFLFWPRKSNGPAGMDALRVSS